MTTDFDQVTAVSPPRASMAALALHWVVDQIIRIQPGAYSLPQTDGGEIWLCPFGSVVSPQRLRTGPGELQAGQNVRITSPGGLSREYEITVSIREVPHVLSQTDDLGEESEDLSRADRAKRADPQAAVEAESQEP